MWAVVYSSQDARTGAIGFKTPQEAMNAVDILNGSLFQGTPIAAASWTNDRKVHSNASVCRYGKRCRGKRTYCLFSHSRISPDPNDSIDDGLQTVIDNLSIVGNDTHENQLGIN